jgi:hypothetical protein
MTSPKTKEELERLAIEWRDKNQCWNCKEQALNAFEGGYRTALIAHQSETELLRNALGKLVRRLDAVHNDPSFLGVWVLAHNHVGPYKGLTYEKELREARQALADDKASEGDK